MPLSILLILVVGGISAIALLLHLSGKSARFVMDDELARSAWRRHFPYDGVTDVTVAHDGGAALVNTNDGMGLIWSFGADTVARYIREFELIDKKGGLTIVFRDYSAPKVGLNLTRSEKKHWQTLILQS